jgi:Transglutaminase-like superfamily
MLTVRIVIEFLRYDLLNALGGFRRLHASVKNTSVSKSPSDPDTVARVCEAVTFAACLYFKPVLCLQRAVVTTRLLRKQGVAASFVIGYRPSPFFSHAWVEVDGRIVNDSQAYQDKLLVLERI